MSDIKVRDRYRVHLMPRDAKYRWWSIQKRHTIGWWKWKKDVWWTCGRYSGGDGFEGHGAGWHPMRFAHHDKTRAERSCARLNAGRKTNMDIECFKAEYGEYEEHVDEWKYEDKELLDAPTQV